MINILLITLNVLAGSVPDACLQLKPKHKNFLNKQKWRDYEACVQSGGKVVQRTPSKFLKVTGQVLNALAGQPQSIGVQAHNDSVPSKKVVNVTCPYCGPYRDASLAPYLREPFSQGYCADYCGGSRGQSYFPQDQTEPGFVIRKNRCKACIDYGLQPKS